MSLTKATPTHSQTILLVEDEKELADEIKTELERLGHHVQMASIAEAADAARVGGAAILVMDRMVFGEDSLNMLEILRKQGVKVPVLVISALSSRALAPTGIALGLSPFLVGFLVWGIGLSLGGVTGYAINPARDFGPRLAHTLLPIAGKRDADWGYAWVPILGPVVGAAVAAGMIRWFGS